MRRIYALALCLVLLITATMIAHSVGGDENDPVITLSYLNKVWAPELKAEAQTQADAELNATYSQALLALAQKVAENNESAAQKNSSNRRAFDRIVLKQGDVLQPLQGCKITLYSGKISADPTLINVTAGEPASGNLIPRNLYMQKDAVSPGLTVTSATAEMTIAGAYSVTSSNSVNYGSLADALSAMGLFRGMTTGYELEGSTTRAQALVMFLRIMGEEEDALKSVDAIPFTDVPTTHWAFPYVSYAYKHGLTNGVSQTAFQPNASVTAQHYLTFLMRALQYAEGSQFTYENVLSDVVTCGLFSKNEVSAMSSGAFLRHKMVYLSYYALFCPNAETNQLLLETLIASGAVQEKNAYSGLASACGWRME